MKADKKLKSLRFNKAQHEMTGFVIIIVLVMIIGVIFLGIFLRKTKPIVVIDAEASNFLISSASMTTDCAQNYEPNYRTLEQLAVDCYDAKTCLDGRNSCELLTTIYGEILPKFRPAGTITSYKMIFSFLQSGNESEVVPNSFMTIGTINASSCASRRSARNQISISGGDIIQQLDICLA
jgi:hypothetical protein